MADNKGKLSYLIRTMENKVVQTLNYHKNSIV